MLVERIYAATTKRHHPGKLSSVGETNEHAGHRYTMIHSNSRQNTRDRERVIRLGLLDTAVLCWMFQRNLISWKWKS